MVEHFCMSSLVVLAASVFEISCGKTDRQTNKQTNTQTSGKTATAVGVDNENAIKTQGRILRFLRVAVMFYVLLYFEVNFQTFSRYSVAQPLVVPPPSTAACL